MNEISSMAKIGLSMLIIASIIITTFCVWSIGSVAANDYFEEQVKLLDLTNSDLSAVSGRSVPCVQVALSIEKSEYYEKLQDIVIYEPYRVNGMKRDFASSSGYREKVLNSNPTKVLKNDYTSKIGQVYEVESLTNGKYRIYVRIGD